MSGSQRLEELRCRRKIDELMKIIPEDGFCYPSLIRELCLKYPVSSLFVKRFIEEFYIDTGLVILKDNILYSNRNILIIESKGDRL